MNDATGGRTLVSGLVAASTIAGVLLFFTGPLRYIPNAALGAVLVKSALSLMDLASLRTIYGTDRRESLLSMLAMLGVVAVAGSAEL